MDREPLHSFSASDVSTLALHRDTSAAQYAVGVSPSPDSC